MHFGTNRRRIDIRDPRMKVAHGGEGPVHIFGIERGRQSVFDAIRYFDGIVKIVARNDRHYRAEYFFLSDAHFGIDIDEHGWLHKIAVLIFAFIETIAAALQASALSLADVHVAEVSFELILIDRGAHLDRFIHTIADLQRFRAFHVALDEIAVDSL